MFENMSTYSTFSTYIIAVKSKDLERGSSSADIVEAGSAVFLMELEERRAIKACNYAFLICLMWYGNLVWHMHLSVCLKNKSK